MRIVVPFTPAGRSTSPPRATANEMTKILGQPVAVENKPGAGGNLGVARRRALGARRLLDGDEHERHPGHQPGALREDAARPNKDLAPVAPIVSLSNVLVVHSVGTGEDVKDVIDLAKKEPGKLTYASSGNGTSIHMSGAMFTQLTGTDIVHIPYKGSAPAITDLLAGQTNMMFDNIPSSLPHIKSGKLRAIATTGAKRDPALPDLPTIAEAGVKGYESGVWFGIMVPAATPRDIIHEAERRRSAGHQVARVREAHARPRLQHHSRLARAHGAHDEGRACALGADREGIRSEGGLNEQAPCRR
jgi:tripartite-type tricarboxylate transporter receptor subunit TctC